MQLEIQRETLLKPLQAIIGVVERRQTLPVLANLLVLADESGLSLTATDLEVELKARIDTPVKGSGECTLPARKVLDIVRNLPEGSSIEVGLNRDRAVMRSGRSRFTLATLPAGDFPTLDDIGAAESLELSQERFRWLIEKAHFAMAVQDVRYYLNGLLLEMSPQQLRAVATDGHRLALAEVSASIALSEPKQVIVPRKGVHELLRLLEASDEPVAIELGANHLRAELPNLRFTSKLIDGRFPEYHRVIPDESGNRVELDRQDLRQALIRVSILSNEKHHGVRFVFDDEGLRIHSNNPEQEEAEESLPVEYDDEAVEIGFNASYLLDALAAIDQPSIAMCVTDANSSALIFGKDAGDSRYVVMPMRL